MLVGKNYKVEADSLNVILLKRLIAKKTHKEYWSPIGYFSRFGNALKSLVDLEVRETELKDFQVVCRKQEELRKLIEGLDVNKKGVRDEQHNN